MMARQKCVVWILAALVLGGAVGFASSYFLQADWGAEQPEQGRSQASLELVEEITQLLERCELPQVLPDEASYSEWLSNYFREHSDRDIETEPTTGFGRPDILIDNALAIELKTELEAKSDQDRCVGQCLGYLQGWDTMLVLIDTPRRDSEHLNTLLTAYRSKEMRIVELSSGDS